MKGKTRQNFLTTYTNQAFINNLRIDIKINRKWNTYSTMTHSRLYAFYSELTIFK